MQDNINQAEHNWVFYLGICDRHPNDFYDWKIICLFYVALHYLKALAVKRGKVLGDRHAEINKNIRSGTHYPTMPISKTAYTNYMALFHYSQTARYDGFKSLNDFNILMEKDYKHAEEAFRQFKLFIISNGVIPATVIAPPPIAEPEIDPNSPDELNKPLKDTK